MLLEAILNSHEQKKRTLQRYFNFLKSARAYSQILTIGDFNSFGFLGTRTLYTEYKDNF